MRDGTAAPSEPLFRDGQPVVLDYSDWSHNRYHVDAEVVGSRFISEGGGWHYTLRIAEPAELDRVDREALEGLGRDLYGWIGQDALRPR